MAEFLSAAWIADLDGAARRAHRDDAPDAAPDGGELLDAGLVVEQDVVDAPGGRVRYQVQFDADGARVLAGAPAVAHLVLVTDYRTARAMHEGRVRAQEALAAGALKVRGSPERLGRAAARLAGLDDAFAAVRARTSYLQDPEQYLQDPEQSDVAGGSAGDDG